MHWRLILVIVGVGLSACTPTDTATQAEAAREAAEVYAADSSGLVLGGLSPDDGWKSTDAYVSEDDECAAVLVEEQSQTFSLVMLLASLDHFTIRQLLDAYQLPYDLERVTKMVGDRTWAPTFDVAYSGREITLDLYRGGEIAFGELCEPLYITPETTSASEGQGLSVDSEGEGLSIELQVPADATPESVDAALAIIGMRLTGIAEDITVEFVRNGYRSVTMNVTGLTDGERAISLITARGEVSLRPVLESYPTSPMIGTDAPNIDPDTGLSIDDDVSNESWLYYEDASRQQVLKVGPAGLVGIDIRAVLPHSVGGSGMWAVELAMSSEGADEFAEMTGQAAAYPFGDPRRQIAIVLDGVVISAPSISPDVQPGVGITDGKAQIAMGDIENAQNVARDLASVIENGSLPTTLEIIGVTPLE